METTPPAQLSALTTRLCNLAAMEDEELCRFLRALEGSDPKKHLQAAKRLAAFYQKNYPSLTDVGR